MTNAAPDGDADNRVGQDDGAVWEQPLPWGPAPDAARRPSARQPRPPKAGPPADTKGPAARVAAVRHEAKPTTQSTAQTGAQPGAQTAERETAQDTVRQAVQEAPSAAAARRAAPEAEQSAMPEPRRGAHAARAPLIAGAGHAVSKRVIGAAVAAGGLLAAVGGIEQLSAHTSAVTVKDEAGPMLHPVDGAHKAGAPAQTSGLALQHAAGAQKPSPSSSPTPSTSPSPAPQVNSQPASDVGAKTQASLLAPAVEAPMLQQGASLSVSTSVDSTNPWWSQSALTLTTNKQLTGLKIVVSIAQTGGVVSTGTWSSLGSQVSVHTAAGSQEVDYVLTMNPGVTIGPGKYVFEFQYNHAQGTRDTSNDQYSVAATPAGSASTESRQGHF